MKVPRYLLRGLVDLLLLLPIVFQLAAFAVVFLASSTGSVSVSIAILVAAGAAFLILCGWAGRRLIERWARSDPPPPPSPSVISRYLPVMIAASYTLVIGLIAICLPIPEDGGVFGAFVSMFAIAHLSSSVILVLLQLFQVPSPWLFLATPLAIYFAYAAGMAWSFRRLGARPVPWAGKAIAGAIVLAALGAILWRAQAIRSEVWLASSESGLPDEIVTRLYQPFSDDNLLVKIAEPGLTISSDWPRLDGATAAYPIYAAAAQAIYSNVGEEEVFRLVEVSKTPEAYERLIAGATDVIFAAQPSSDQLAAAEMAGVTLKLTPIGKEAFVFFVSTTNPVNDLRPAQIRDIYTKRVTNWAEVGGADEAIVAFQRPAGSGSQTALEKEVMAGEALPDPPREEMARGMGEIIRRAAAYRNAPGAIGYSFRYFATTMHADRGIKLLAIDGIKPTRDTIRAERYPFTVDIYAITAGTKNPHAQELVDWFLTPAGQRLIDETGYVSLDD